ncbi:MAG: methylenetetrahydrofolate reductase C-terminal domain-containing protein [Candidatus Binatia bacterium]
MNLRTDASRERGPLPAWARGPRWPGGVRGAAAPLTNPLHDLIAAGKMPVILELHLTEADRIGYQKLRQRYLAQGYALPQLLALGQYLRQMDVTRAELAPEEGSLVHKLQVYADLVSAGGVDLLALDDGSRGHDALDNAIAAELLVGLGAAPERLLANVVARNRQAAQIRQRLMHFAELGVRNALLLTGDLPLGGKPAKFPLDSVGMCALAREMLIEGALPDDFWIAAAGHPNPDADPEGLRTLQKALAGARVIITQAIYSVDEFARWMQSLRQVGALDRVHVLAEVIPITSGAQLRAIADVPGMRVPPDLIAQMDAAKARLEQAATAAGHSPAWNVQRLRAEGARVTRDMLHQIRRVPGVSGFYLGCVKGFSAHLELLREAPLLIEHEHALHKMTKLSGAERQRALADGAALESYIDGLRREAERRARRRRWFGALAESGAAQRVLQALESPKVPVFGCEKCDRCDLSPDALVCPRGCAKQMTHGSCGAPRLVDGRMLCEDTSRECTWAAIRARRELYGVPVADRLGVREAPSPGFFEGQTYSAFLPVLAGLKRGPDWSLAWRAPVAHCGSLFRRDFKLPAEGSPRDLLTLAASQAEPMLSVLEARPGADREELWIKMLALIGTPAAWWLIESRLAELGLPAEGTMADLSLREQFQLAEALPAIRGRAAAGGGALARALPALSDELLAVVPEGRRLRRGMRRELANALISHIGALGIAVTYAESMLEAKNVDDFLGALTVLKDELQVARARLPFARGGLSVHFHRVHYKHHYHAPVAIARFHAADGAALPRAALRIDLRQYRSPAHLRGNLRGALEALARDEGESAGALALEDFGPGLQSVIWAFNAEFWERLRDFEQATGRDYDASIGGSSDHNLAYARSSARALFDKVHDHRLTDGRLYILEIGVASTHRARTFLGELRRICELTGTDYHRRVTYVLADFSEQLLASAAAEMAQEDVAVETVQIDAADPERALAPYRGRVLHAHLCNVYDNLPGDLALWSEGRWYRIEVRAYVPRERLEDIAAQHGFDADAGAALARQLAALGGAVRDGDARGASAASKTGAADQSAVSRFLDWARQRLAERGRPPAAYVHFWMDLFAAVRLDERYVAVADLADLLPAGIAGLEHPGQALQRHVAGEGEVRVHLNQAALAGFAQLLPMLQAHGTLEIVDLFVQRLEEYGHAFKGPAKYDGSTVNWLNGPLFRAVAEQLGYTVRFQSFRPFDPKSVSVVLLAYPRA